MSDEQKREEQEEQKQRSGAGLFVKWALLVVIGLPVAWFAFCEARKAYWDWRVTQMCEEDEGVVIYERALVPKKYLSAEGYIRVPPLASVDRKPFKWEATADDPIYSETTNHVLKRRNPKVGITTVKIVRAHDKKVMGEAKFYQRSGGDALVIDHPSHFSCPKGGVEQMLANAIFGEVNDASK